MEFVYGDKQKRAINQKEEIKFSSFSSFHLIVITARSRSEKQISKDATDDEELIVKIDGKTFPKLGSKEALLDSPASFNGGQLHNLSKTIYFFTFLQGKDHTIILETDEPHNTATFESVKIFTLDLHSKIALKVGNQAEDGDRRPWVTLVFDHLPLLFITPTITYAHRKRDSDDVKIIIDGKTHGNILRKIRHFLWRYAGSLLPWVPSTKTETETFNVDLPQGPHYVELHADRMPTLRSITIDFGEKPQPPIRIPTVDYPKWTGNFYDDAPSVLLARLILGEAENEPKEAKIWITGSVLNRVNAKAWPNTVHEVILQPDQYDPLKTSDPNFAKVITPLTENESDKRKSEWQESFEIARGILFGEITNPTEATHFHGRGVSKEWFLDNIVPNGRWIKTINDTYFYWSPN